MILAFTQLLSQRICMGYSRQIQENGKWAESCTSPRASSLLQLGAWERMKRWFANGSRSMAWTSHFEHSLLPLFHPLRFAPTSPLLSGFSFSAVLGREQLLSRRWEQGKVLHPTGLASMTFTCWQGRAKSYLLSSTGTLQTPDYF